MVELRMSFRLFFALFHRQVMAFIFSSSLFSSRVFKLINVSNMQWQFYEIMYQKIKSRKFQTMFQTISFHLLRRKTSLEGRKRGEKWRSSVFKQHFQLKQFFGCLESFAQEERRSQKVPHYTSHYCIWAGDLLEVCESVVIIIFLN